MEVAYSQLNNRLGNYKLNSFTYILLVFKFNWNRVKSHSSLYGCYLILISHFEKPLSESTSQNENQASNFLFYKFLSSSEGFYKNTVHSSIHHCADQCYSVSALCYLLMDWLFSSFEAKLGPRVPYLHLYLHCWSCIWEDYFIFICIAHKTIFSKSMLKATPLLTDFSKTKGF